MALTRIPASGVITGTTFTFNSINLTATTITSSTATGSLVLAGGLGVGGSGYIGGNLTVLGTINATISGVATSATNIAGGTVGQIPYQSSAGATSFFGPGSYGQFLMSNGASAPGYQSTLTQVNGNIVITSNSGASSTTTGALQVTGGVGVGGGIYVGGIITATNVFVNGYAVSTASALTIQGAGVSLGSAGTINFATGTIVTVGSNLASVWLNTATLMTTAVNLAGGSAGQFAYQTGAGVTSFMSTGSMYVGRASLADTATTATSAATAYSTIGTLTAGTGLTGTAFNGSANQTWTLNTATLMQVATKVVQSHSTGTGILGSSFDGSTAQTWTLDTSTLMARAVQTVQSLTAGTGLSGTAFNGSTAQTWSLNTATLMADAVTAINLAGGSAGQFAYQTGAGATSFMSTGSMYVGRAVYADSASGSAGSVANAVTFNNAGSGDASGTTYNGSAARTISYNTLGAMPTTGGTFSGPVTFGGAVTFSGTATYVLSTQTFYTDNILNLHVPPAGVNGQWTLDDGKDVGFKFHYYTNSTDTNAALVLANDTKWLEWYSSGAEGTSTFAGSTYGNFKTGGIWATSGAGVGYTSSQIGEKFGVNGGAYVNGTLTATTFVGAMSGSLSAGTGLTGSAYNGSANQTWTLNTATLMQVATQVVQSHSTGTGILGGSYNGGTAVTWSLNTATLMTTAVNLAGGSAGQFAYQTGAGATSFASTSSMYVGRAVYADSASGSAGSVANALTIGTGLTGTAGTYNGSAAVTISLNTATLVQTATQVVQSHSAGTGLTGSAYNGSTAQTWSLNTATLMQTAVSAINLSAGSAMALPYQSASGTTAYLAAGTSGYILQTNGTGSAPSWVAVSGLSAGTATNADNLKTIMQTASATYYPAFVDSNNSTAAYEAYYTTSTFTINPATGAVGIGGTSTAKLHVNGSGAVPSPNATTNSNGLLRLRTTDAVYVDIGAYNSSPWTTWIQSGDTGSASYYAMAINPLGGNVSIGTATQGKKLTISRPTETTSEQLEFRNEGGITTGNYDGIVWTQGSSGGTTLSSIRLNYNSSGAPDMAFNLRNESNVLFLKNGGSVGINTSSPVATMDVRGGLAVSGWSNNNGGSAGGLEIGWDGTQGLIQSYNRTGSAYTAVTLNGSINKFLTSGTERLRITASGGMAFGGASNYGSSGQILQSNGDASPTWVNASAITAGSASLTATYVGYGSGSNTLTGSSGLTYASSILNVSYQNSFNTTTPGTGTYGIHLNGQTTNDYATGITFAGGGSSAGSAQAGIYSQGSGSYGTKMYFATTDSYASGAKTRMMIDHGGNVGIGTTSPAALLHLYKSSDAYIRVQAGGGNYSYLQLDDASSNGYLIKNISASTANGALAGALYTYTDNSKAFQHIHGGTALFTILSGGNVGIGNTSPDAKLRVDGNVMVYGEGNGVMVDTSTAALARVGLMKYGGYEGMLIAGTGTVLRLGHRTDSAYVYGGTPTIREDLVITSAGGVSFNGAGNYGSSGQILQSNGNSAPTWVNASSITSGGTSLTSTYVGYGSASNTLTGSSNVTWNGTKFYVNGYLDINGDSSPTGAGLALGFNSTGGYKWIQSFNSQPLYINALGNNVVFNRDSGDVLIGQTTVSYSSGDNTPLVGSNTTNRLHVNGSIQLTNNNDAIVFGRGTSSFLKDEELGFGWGGGWYMTDTTYLRVRNNKTIYSADGEIDLRNSGVTASTNRLYFNPYNGPGGGSSSYNYGSSSAGGTSLGTGIVWTPNYSGYSKRSAGILNIAEGNYFRSGIAFYTNNIQDQSTDWTEAMRIGSNGNVSIGQGSSPDLLNKFDVYGSNGQLFSVSDSFTGTIFSANDISGIPSIEVLDTGLVKFAQYNGAVAISTGTIVSGSALSVYGIISTIGTSGEIRASSEITAYYSSDERLKENVNVISNPIELVQQMRGVFFDWTDEHIQRRGGEDGFFVRKHDIGVIAQEVESVLPEIVATRDDGYKAVKYEKLVPLLIEAVKSQQQTIDELKAELQEIKNLIKGK